MTGGASTQTKYMYNKLQLPNRFLSYLHNDVLVNCVSVASPEYLRYSTLRMKDTTDRVDPLSKSRETSLERSSRSRFYRLSRVSFRPSFRSDTSVITSEPPSRGGFSSPFTARVLCEAGPRRFTASFCRLVAFVTGRKEGYVVSDRARYIFQLQVSDTTTRVHSQVRDPSNILFLIRTTKK